MEQRQFDQRRRGHARIFRRQQPGRHRAAADSQHDHGMQAQLALGKGDGGPRVG